jgi:spermidine synthase
MKTIQRRAFFLFFFLSGFCSLAYQVIWMRLALADFGVITPVLSVVVSVFMAGLLLGTLAAGKWIHALTEKTGVPAIHGYALAEIVAATGAFAVPTLFSWGQAWLLSAGESNSAAYLWRSALVIVASLLPWCLAMGATIPFILAYSQDEQVLGEESFSFLYLANVLGAMAGVLLSALVMIEAMGFRHSLALAGGLNLGVGVAAILLGLLSGRGSVSSPQKPEAVPAPAAPVGGNWQAWVLFLTGFCSMAMEVVWTRAFTPVVGTQVYSFAAILFSYLCATCLGSWLYRAHLARGRAVAAPGLLGFLVFSAALPLMLNDPRLGWGLPAALLGIVPFCLGLGYLTPALVDRRAQGDPVLASRSYALNILGCCLGPLLASYVLLPLMGVKGSLLILALPFLVLQMGTLMRPLQGRGLVQVVMACAVLLGSWSFAHTYEDRKSGLPGPWVLRRDATATVISCGEGMGKRLFVNGVGITQMTTVTKVMAHLPLSLLKSPPTAALTICFGMGTTFRALTQWGIPVTAVELVPSVRDAFGFYFQDAPEVLGRKGASIVVDDGRRFLSRSQDLYDVITVDPPPPTEAAASSLLYSEEFCRLAKAHLKPGGILQQWVPGGDAAAIRAMVHSLMNTFPHVRMFVGFEGWGCHFLASESPLDGPGAEGLVARMPPAARKDLMEWRGGGDPVPFMRQVLSGEIDPLRFARGMGKGITDDRPYNEYYILRTLFPAWRDKLN